KALLIQAHSIRRLSANFRTGRIWISMTTKRSGLSTCQLLSCLLRSWSPAARTFQFFSVFFSPLSVRFVMLMGWGRMSCLDLRCGRFTSRKMDPYYIGDKVADYL